MPKSVYVLNWRDALRISAVLFGADAMSGAKFYVWGGGRWRELSAGRVEGWGAARFVCVREGRLELLPRARVLRGLRALAAARPRAVRDGPPLSQIRLEAPQKNAVQAKARQRRGGYQGYEGREGEGCAHCHQRRCCPAPPSHQYCRCIADANFNRLLKTDASTQVSRSSSSPHPAPACTHIDATTSGQPYMKENLRRSQVGHGAGPPGGRGRPWGGVYTEIIIEENTVALMRGVIERGAFAPLFHVDLPRFDRDDDYKRLVFYRINPLVRLARSRRVDRLARDAGAPARAPARDSRQVDFASVLGLQSVADTSSQHSSSYRTRTKTLQQIRNDAQRKSNIERLGSVDDGTDKENRTRDLPAPGPSRANGDASAGDLRRFLVARVRRPPPKKADAGVVVSDDEASAAEQMKRLRPTAAAPAKPANKPTVIAKKGSGGGREYSRLEDEAIVRWVRAGSRARLVNGNRLWRDLPPLHHQHTGRWRSWHSLRNRYLRYVLPRLAALPLPAAAAARLRAAAAAGEIKQSRSKAPARRNSVFVEARVRSAWARRPRPGPAPSPPPSPPPSSPPPGPSAPASRAPQSPHSRSPSPSHSPSSYGSSEANSSDSDAQNRTSPAERVLKKRWEVDEGVQAKPARTLRSSAAGCPRSPRAPRPPRSPRSPTYSDLTRRFATPRAASGSARPPSPPPPPPPPARTARTTRRLYNPKHDL